jgi:hypothetical protein
MKISKNDPNISKVKIKKSKQDYSPQERHAMIEKKAYYGAYARGFGESNALGDWLSAEQYIDAELAN